MCRDHARKGDVNICIEKLIYAPKSYAALLTFVKLGATVLLLKTKQKKVSLELCAVLS